MRRRNAYRIFAASGWELASGFAFKSETNCAMSFPMVVPSWTIVAISFLSKSVVSVNIQQSSERCIRNSCGLCVDIPSMDCAVHLLVAIKKAAQSSWKWCQKEWIKQEPITIYR